MSKDPVGRYGQVWAGTGKYREVRGGMGRYEEVRGQLRRCFLGGSGLGRVQLHHAKQLWLHVALTAAPAPAEAFCLIGVSGHQEIW